MGPLHLLSSLTENIYNLRPVEYIHRKTPTGFLAKQLTRLRNHEEGAVVDTFRRVVELQAHPPTKLWSL